MMQELAAGMLQPLKEDLKGAFERLSAECGTTPANIQFAIRFREDGTFYYVLLKEWNKVRDMEFVKDILGTKFDLFQKEAMVNWFLGQQMKPYGEKYNLTTWEHIHLVFWNETDEINPILEVNLLQDNKWEPKEKLNIFQVEA